MELYSRKTDDPDFYKKLSALADAFIESVKDEFDVHEPEDSVELFLVYKNDRSIVIHFSVEKTVLIYDGEEMRSFEAPKCCMECFVNDLKGAARHYSILSKDANPNPNSKWAS